MRPPETKRSTPLLPRIGFFVIAFLVAAGSAPSIAKEQSKPRPTATDATLRIDEFWQWWRTAAPRLAAKIDAGQAASIAGEVGARVEAIDSRLSWETGPGRKGARHHLALSSEGDIELRILTERWLARGPAADATWEYYPARQAFPRSSTWSLKLDNLEIDFPKVAVKFETVAARELVSLVLYHPAIAKLDERGRARVAFLTLDNLLGEDGVERWIGEISTSAEPLPGAGSLDDLAASVKALEKSATGERFTILKKELPDGGIVVATVNLALKRVDHLLMDRSLVVTMPLREPTPAGLTTDAEAATLNALEDELTGLLGRDAIYIGRETGHSTRTLYFHVGATAPAEDRARAWTQRHSERQIGVTIERDPRWEVLRRW
jgi:hypothetical protein